MASGGGGGRCCWEWGRRFQVLLPSVSHISLNLTQPRVRPVPIGLDYRMGKDRRVTGNEAPTQARRGQPDLLPEISPRLRAAEAHLLQPPDPNMEALLGHIPLLHTSILEQAGRGLGHKVNVPTGFFASLMINKTSDLFNVYRFPPSFCLLVDWFSLVLVEL